MQPQIVIMGDRNCNLLNNWSVDAKALLGTCNELNLSQIIEEPTRITAQTRSLLDVIMITPLSKVKTMQWRYEHRYKRPLFGIHVRSYKSYDPICFKREVEELSLHHVNSKLDLFNGLFLNTLNRPAPMKYKKKQRKTADVKFIGKEIKQLMKVRY